ncbi:hypothetical protein [Rubellimicrobium arenae]|uniref:hypothetical protein n=1 Tax=Rubellimicrobium arenae TaxID=2817372 RepID=UPI001B3081CC|nr:hypothetical protein [Rubellimicrobium arenae]
MSLSHLMIGVLGGLAAVVAWVVLGHSWWLVPFVYPLAGNLCLALSFVLRLGWDHVRRTAHRAPSSAWRTAPAHGTRLAH